jgi:hypothetical protein
MGGACVSSPAHILVCAPVPTRSVCVACLQASASGLFRRSAVQIAGVFVSLACYRCLCVCVQRRVPYFGPAPWSSSAKWRAACVAKRWTVWPFHASSRGPCVWTHSGQGAQCAGTGGRVTRAEDGTRHGVHAGTFCHTFEDVAEASGRPSFQGRYELLAPRGVVCLHVLS